MKAKKLLVLLLALSMVVSVAACGITDEDDIRGQVNNGTNTQDNSSSKDSEENTENTEGSTVLEDTESTQTTENNGPSLSLNNANGSTYESKFIGIGWTLPEGWTFFDEEQLKEMNNIAADMIDDEQIKETLENATLICDMYAMNASTGDTINIQLEKLSGLASLYDENAYIDASMGTLSDALQSAGYTNTTVEKTTITIAGKEQLGLSITTTYAGVIIYEQMACIKVDNYMAIITAGSVTSATVDDIMANFYLLK